MSAIVVLTEFWLLLLLSIQTLYVVFVMEMNVPDPIVIQRGITGLTSIRQMQLQIRNRVNPYPEGPSATTSTTRFTKGGEQ